MAVNISHIKALGVDVWGRERRSWRSSAAARARASRCTADQYPYLASGSSVGASLLPRWAEAGGRDSLLARLADPATRAARDRGHAGEPASPRRRGRAAHHEHARHEHTRQAARRDRRGAPGVAGRGGRSDHPRRRRVGRVIQHARRRPRSVRARAVGHDRLGRVGRPPAQVRHLPAQAAAVRARPADADHGDRRCVRAPRSPPRRSAARPRPRVAPAASPTSSCSIRPPFATARRTRSRASWRRGCATCS